MNPFKYRGGGLFAGVFVLGLIVWLCLYGAARMAAGDAGGMALTLPGYGFYAGLFSALVVWAIGIFAAFKLASTTQSNRQSPQLDRDPLSALIGRPPWPTNLNPL